MDFLIGEVTQENYFIILQHYWSNSLSSSLGKIIRIVLKYIKHHNKRALISADPQITGFTKF